MTTIGIDTDAIIQGGRTFISRNLVKVAKKETFGLGVCSISFDRLIKARLITKALARDNNYTQEEIQCLESELLGEIQSRENLQAITRVPGSAIAGGDPIDGAINISEPEPVSEPGPKGGG